MCRLLDCVLWSAFACSLVPQLVDVSYGGDNGFNQAIELSQEALANVKFVQEKKLIAKFFEEISQDTGKFCFGVGDTLKALELGAVKTLIVFENLEIMRYEIKNNSTGEVNVLHLNKEQQVRLKWRRPSGMAALDCIGVCAHAHYIIVGCDERNDR